MKIEFLINEYVFSHGHAPRGHGYWAFKFSRNGAPFFVPSCSYAEAKRQVRAMAEKKGIVQVWVCS